MKLSQNLFIIFLPTQFPKITWNGTPTNGIWHQLNWDKKSSPFLVLPHKSQEEYDAYSTAADIYQSEARNCCQFLHTNLI